MDREHWLQGGHVYYDDRTSTWVALSYVAILGRFATRAEAVLAVQAEAQKFKEK